MSVTFLTNTDKQELKEKIDELNFTINDNKDYNINHFYDTETQTQYTFVRVYKDKIDGTKQYPFTYAPNEDGIPTMSPLEVAKSEGFKIALNAGMGASWRGPIGMLIQNGEVIHHAPSVGHEGCKPLTIDSNGDLWFVEYDADAEELINNGIVSAVTGFMPIVIDYVAVPSTQWNNIDHYTEAAQRQIIGQFSNGDYAIITSEGRGFNNSIGWTIEDAQSICVKHGLKFAYNLDGGGSTATVIGKKQLGTIYENTDGRKVPVCIVFNGGTNSPVNKVASSYGIYTILKNVNISDYPAYVSDGTPFSATLSVDEGYMINNIKVIMRGLDITDSCFNGDTITIPRITGKVDIIADAIYSDYTFVNYIESTGTQYIQSESIMLGNKDIYGTLVEIEADVMFTSINSGKRQLMGTNPIHYFGINTSGKYEFSNVACTMSPSGDTFDNINIRVNTDGETSAGEMSINGNVVASKTVAGTGTKGLFTLCALGDCDSAAGIYNGFEASCRIKYCKVTIDGVVVGEFKPCYRKSDNIVGMYDTVSKQFLQNKGTGVFLYG